jgi:hypothetical protein
MENLRNIEARNDNILRQILLQIDTQVESVLDQHLKNLKPVIKNIPNPNYDPSLIYVPRSERPEWSAVGIKGLLRVRDNGECQVGHDCDCLDGIAVPGSTWQVLRRISPNVIEIFI